ncbi:MAG: glycine betaine/L-proline ABC transporter ATP-binding protein [Candidatus Marinimicrobia bacterium]|nr:glycine betaine/L-proline ABC transporter ATP-binding protein [Candidatus Neomarinimicrobiota bacterium]MCF7827374.1 glycine betaine/L-proline ABC transporter ATP-binding protein [Candidatus Neomarinimicrobiota bacterium]MCF7881393.1 glycine betaine/L-proline ABC transporter ATP-binding protein [Candidatus Neomarinimicrobiota bacterium]
MSKIRVENLYKVFGPKPKKAISMVESGKSKEEILDEISCTVAVNNASLEIELGEIFVVMGLSGSGKSTLLRCLNRLIEPTDGEIFLDDGEIEVLAAGEEELRKIRRSKMAMVFQHFGLLPHRTVSDNVSFGLEIQGVDAKARKEKAYETIKTVGLSGYEEKMTGELSGGMQQRVGLARALATDPEILLMDEAFSALDPLIRTNMQDELLELQSKVQKTIVFITHDLDEALKLGDRIAIMNQNGQIEQVGTTEEILSNPASDYVEAFVENVDRSKVITATSIMFDHPERVVEPKEGPGVAVRRMRKWGISHLAVTDSDNTFEGFVAIDDAVKLQKEKKNTLESVIQHSDRGIAPDTPVADLLPMVWDNNIPVVVVDENGAMKGIVYRPSVIAEITGETLESEEKLDEPEEPEMEVSND